MKENERKTNIKKWCIAGVLLLCIFAITIITVTLSGKGKKESGLVAIYVQEQGSDYIFTSRDNGLSWADGNVPAFFMTAQDKEIRQDGEGITGTIKNNSDDVVTYGEEFSLYRWSENTWVPCETAGNSYFPQLLKSLQPNDVCEMDCSLHYYQSGQGRYLLTKGVTWKKDQSAWDLSVEFVVN